MEKETNSKEVKDTIIKASKAFIDTLEKEEEGIVKGLILSFYQTEKNIKDDVANIRVEAYVTKEDLAKLLIVIIEQDEDLKKIFLFKMLEQTMSRAKAKEKPTVEFTDPNITYN